MLSFQMESLKIMEKFDGGDFHFGSSRCA
jgi:hypothetical protein